MIAKILFVVLVIVGLFIARNVTLTAAYYQEYNAPAKCRAIYSKGTTDRLVMYEHLGGSQAQQYFDIVNADDNEYTDCVDEEANHNDSGASPRSLSAASVTLERSASKRLVTRTKILYLGLKLKSHFFARADVLGNLDNWGLGFVDIVRLLGSAYSDNGRDATKTMDRIRDAFMAEFENPTV